MTARPIFDKKYENIIEQLMSRKLIVQLPGGIATPIDLNKNEGFFDMDIDDRQDINAIRLVIGRETVTISRKNEVTDEYSEGFFYHIMERDRPVQIQGKTNILSPLQVDTIGFCYQADGAAIEFYFDYSHIMTQLCKRDKMIADMQRDIEETFDSDIMIELEGKLNRLVNSPLNFNISRNTNEHANVIEKGLPIHLYYKMTEEETQDFSTKHTAFRKKFLAEQKRKKGKSHNLEIPLLPRLTKAGLPPTVQFTVRTSGNVADNV